MRSDEAIKRGFRKLLETNPPSSVTIIDICNEAGVSRRAFYNLFADRNDVIEHILDDDIVKPVHTLNDLFGIGTLKTSPLLITERVYTNLYNNKNYYISLVSQENTRHVFVDLVIKKCRNLVDDLFRQSVLPEEERLYIAYLVASAHAMVLQRWISEGMTTSPLVMAKYFDKWILSSISPESMGFFLPTGR